MKFRHALILAISTILLAACNFTLAADVTPPPGYVPPTPIATLGPLFPAAAPDTANGAAIFVEKCMPCHGETGMGDGPQSADLPVSVAALGLPETANKAVPAAWYTQVTRGNLERFMPPFASLTDQERWDVVAYALTLHTTPAQIEAGKNLFNANCDADCAKIFSSQEMMSALSQDDIAFMVQNGEDAFGSSFTDQEAADVAAYIRTLTFAAPQAAPTVAPVTETPVAADAVGTPSAETTPVEGTPQTEVTPEAVVVAGIGNISGSVDNQTGAALPADLKVELRGFEHGGDPSAGPQEIISLEGAINADGSYLFENVELPENRIYLAEINMNGIKYQSEFAVIAAETTELNLTPITVYGTTEDFSVLQVDALQYYFDYANETDVQIIAVYSITNPTNKAVIIKVDAAQEIPFIKMPEGVTSMGYEASQDSAPFTALEDGFAMLPTTDTPYGLIAFATVAKDKKISLEQTVVLPVTEVMLLIPAGVTAEGETLSDSGVHDFEGGTFTMYTSPSMAAGDTFSFTLSGEPKSTAVNPDLTQNQTLLIGIGALGLTLILAGAWLYWRDTRKNKADILDEDETDEDEEDDDDEYDDAESILDAIVAIDDLHRAGKISDEAYQKRRAELKSALKRKS